MLDEFLHRRELAPDDGPSRPVAELFRRGLPLGIVAGDGAQVIAGMLLREMHGVGLAADGEDRVVAPAHLAELRVKRLYAGISLGTFLCAQLYDGKGRLVVPELAAELLAEVVHARTQFRLLRLDVRRLSLQVRAAALWRVARMSDGAGVGADEYVARRRIEGHLPREDVVEAPESRDEALAVACARPREESGIEESVRPDEAVGELAVEAEEQEMRKLLALPEKPLQEDDGRLQDARDGELHADEGIGFARDRDLPFLQLPVLPHDGPRRAAKPEHRKRSLLRMDGKKPLRAIGKLESEKPDVSEETDIALAVAAAAGNDLLPFARLYAATLLVCQLAAHLPHIPFNFG